MIVSHEHKFIFVKTRKTAGTSLEIALSKYCGPRDILAPLDATDEPKRAKIAGGGARNYQKALSEHRMSEFPRLVSSRTKAIKYNEHMTATQMRAALPKDVWDSYFKFTVVRNPFDRCISRYFWTLNNGEGQFAKWKVGSFDQFLRYHAQMINENWLIYTEGDALLVDDVVKFETLEADLGRVSARIGLKRNVHEDMKSVETKTQTRAETDAPQSVIDERARQTIYNLCIREFEMFGYAPEPAHQGDGAR